MVVARGGTVKRSGVVIGVHESTDTEDSVELWHSTQFASTASSLWTVTQYPPTTKAAYTVAIPFPPSTRYRYFKARSQKLGHSPSPFTPIIRGKPVMFADYPKVPPPLTNNLGYVEFTGPTFFNSDHAPQVGAPSQVSPTTFLSKALRVAHGAFVPESSGSRVTRAIAYVQPLTTALANVIASLEIPTGVTINSLSAKLYRETTSATNTASLSLFRIANNVSSLVANVNLTTAGTTGWQLETSTAFTETVTSTRAYALYAQLRGPAGGAGADARLQYAEISYSMPTYARTI